jgi:hypothetical protein
MKWLVATVITLLVFVFSSFPVNAQASTYTVDYNFSFAPDSKENLDVKLQIHLKNLRSDLYINEFSLTFPPNFITGSIKAEDAEGPVEFVRQDIATGMKITFKFNEPNAQKAEHFLTLTYKLNDLFSNQGFVTEAILPLIQPDEHSKVNAELLLPPTFNSTMSIAKPVPSNIEGTRIVWDDVKVRTIYGVFGSSQLYKASLSYNLENTTVFTKIQQVVFPPDTLYQKVFINKLSEEPQRVFTDDDGNTIAEYQLEPKEKKKISLDVSIEVFAKAQESMREVVRTNFEKQKKYLLTEHDLWKVGSLTGDSRLKDIKDVRDVYRFVVNELSYSFDKIQKGNKRLGAKAVLERPSLAVCTEYTDLFVGLAREKGIFAREVQGYGYSTKQSIRPLSLVTDVLHAWPEFYEPAQNMWIQVDPTWEDTSGIDYFSGLDVNHIVFAIHGKSPVNPLPVGFYKTSASKDINIEIASERPKDNPRVSVTADFPKAITPYNYSEALVHVKNTGNTSFHDLRLNITSKYISAEEASIHVGFIAPYETKSIPVKLKAHSNSPSSDKLTLDFNGIEVFSQKVVIDESRPRSGTVLIFTGVGIMTLLLGSLIFRSHH